MVGGPIFRYIGNGTPKPVPCYIRTVSPSTATGPDHAASSPRGYGAAYLWPRCCPPRPDPTTRRPLFAALTRLARGVAVVAPRPDRAAPTLAVGARLFRGHVVRHCPRGLMSVAQPRRCHRHCAPALPRGVLLSRERRDLPAGAA